jgi:hypothetical protein
MRQALTENKPVRWSHFGRENLGKMIATIKNYASYGCSLHAGCEENSFGTRLAISLVATKAVKVDRTQQLGLLS